MKRSATHWPLTLLGSASSVFNLFLPIVMSRHLSAAAVGEFKAFFLYLGAVPALSLGVGFTNGTYLWGAQKERGEGKVRAAFAHALAAGIAAAALVALAAVALGLPYPLLWFAAACPPAVAAPILEASLVARGRVREGALFGAGFELVRVGALLVAARLGADPATLFLLHAAASWAKLLAGAWLLGFPRPGEARRERPELLRYAIPVSGAAVFDLLVLNADRYVLSLLLDAASFAVYAFGCLMVPPLFVFEQAVNQVLIPRLARTRPGSRAAATHHRAAVECLLLLLVPASAGLIALAEPLVRMLFSDAYRSAAPFLAWYACYYALSAIPQDVLARARGDSSWIFRTAVLFGTGALAATWLGARFFGAMGALQAFLLVQALRRAYAIAYFLTRERGPIRRMFPVPSAAVILAASAAAAAAAWLVAARFPHPAHAFLAGTAAFAPVYFGLVLALRPRALRRLLRFRGGP